MDDRVEALVDQVKAYGLCSSAADEHMLRQAMEDTRQAMEDTDLMYTLYQDEELLASCQENQAPTFWFLEMTGSTENASFFDYRLHEGHLFSLSRRKFVKQKFSEKR